MSEQKVTHVNRGEIPFGDVIGVKGRGLREPRTSTTATMHCLTLRVECEHNDEFWVEVELPIGTLLDFLGRVAALDEHYAAELVRKVNALAGAWSN